MDHRSSSLSPRRWTRENATASPRIYTIIKRDSHHYVWCGSVTKVSVCYACFVRALFVCAPPRFTTSIGLLCVWISMSFTVCRKTGTGCTGGIHKRAIDRKFVNSIKCVRTIDTLSNVNVKTKQNTTQTTRGEKAAQSAVRTPTESIRVVGYRFIGAKCSS